MTYSKLAPAAAGLVAALAMLAVPSTAHATAAQAQAQGVHRQSAACTSPKGQKINVSWGDGNVSTTVYFNNHCNQKRWIELKFVKQNHDYFWKCFSVNPRTSGKKKIGYSNPDKVVITKAKTNC
ncbi:hypothetical protein [Nonomuraea gerenzanensis]|uniref:Secreted protein n=1 Tax=Nonomuraea gerenzanensis TaxID=93944 RepID=A0A1M4EAT1_9ACTN|nr:hypothetical protein [Nonomuraea gerenzanensis]UBU18191.1 hypothetical protein LCN96_25155 [Nonomuraea gerenzanensis]SBO96005.1 hypothetical protein BN4615_P5521 [Nonomuraea gerenzanensis]